MLASPEQQIAGNHVRNGVQAEICTANDLRPAHVECAADELVVYVGVVLKNRELSIDVSLSRYIEIAYVRVKVGESNQCLCSNDLWNVKTCAERNVCK
jgi:hypothetical protein